MDERTVEEYRQGKAQHFQTIVIYHIPIIDKILHKYVCTGYTFEDLQEVAYFELVLSVRAAQQALHDNNITPYILRWVGLNILSYVTTDHLIIYPKKVSSRVVNLVKRKRLEDVANKVDPIPIETMVFWEKFHKAISDNIQQEIVDLRLQGHTFNEIANRLPGRSIMYIHRRWNNFVKRMEQ